jgi:hypothetical protein
MTRLAVAKGRENKGVVGTVVVESRPQQPLLD